LHDLRHSFASAGAAGGLSLPVIGALLGHKDPKTTQRYAHLADDQ
jgi:site-specific recombinase XerD